MGYARGQRRWHDCSRNGGRRPTLWSDANGEGHVMPETAHNNVQESVSQRIRVAVISPVRIYRQGLTHLLEKEDGVELAGTAPGVDEAAPLLARTGIDVILLDMTGDMAGKRGLEALHR